MKNSFRCILLLILLTGLIHPLQAQQKSSVKLGIKASPILGFLLPDTRGYQYDGVKGSAIVGLISDFYFAERYAFSTGLNFSFLNGKIAFEEQVIRDGDTLVGNMNRSINWIYLEIPYTAKLSTKTFGRFSFFGQIGFSTGFRLKAKAIDNFEPQTGEGYKEKYSYSENTTLIRQSVIVGLGTELHLDQNSRIILGLSYSNSLNNVLKGTNQKEDLKEKGTLNYVELNLGILF